MRIWKWTLDAMGTQVIAMPVGAKILTIQVQSSSGVCLWALCDEKQAIEARRIVVYATGELVPDNAGEYVGTFQLSDGMLVFHVFDLGVVSSTT